MKHHFAEFPEKYQDLEEIPDHVKHVREDILVNVKELIKGDDGQQPSLFGRGQPGLLPTQKVCSQHAGGQFFTVGEGKFHIWAIRNADEGIKILTSVKTGERQEDGYFEPDTVNARADANLSELAERLAQYGKHEEK